MTTAGSEAKQEITHDFSRYDAHYVTASTAAEKFKRHSHLVSLLVNRPVSLQKLLDFVRQTQVITGGDLTLQMIRERSNYERA